MDKNVISDITFNRLQDLAIKHNCSIDALLNQLLDEMGKDIPTSFNTTREKSADSVTSEMMLLKEVSDAIIRTDLRLSIIDWNIAATTIYGWSEAEAIGQDIDELLHTVWISESQTSAQATLIATGNWHGEIQQTHKDGHLLYIWASVNLNKNANGDIIGGITINRNITERKKAEQDALEFALERKRIQILADFIGHTSHELRTPLTVINNSAYLLLHAQTEEQKQNKITQITKQVSYLDKMINQLHEMTQLDSMTNCPLLPLDLNQMISRFLDAFTLHHSTLIMQKKYDENLPMIAGNEDLISLCLLQLAENAVRYSENNSTVIIHTRFENNKVVVAFEDHGIGIAQEHVAHIFEHFYKANKARTRHRDEGVGVGLTIVHRIMELHHGQVTVESEVGKGSTFSLHFPTHATQLN